MSPVVAPSTTAEALGALHKELTEQGLTPEVIREVVVMAARSLVGENLVVRSH